MTQANEDLSPLDLDSDGAITSATEDEARFDRVSATLKEAFQALGTADIPQEDKAAWHKRLIAITNSAKHDLATAEARLDRYTTEWQATVA